MMSDIGLPEKHSYSLNLTFLKDDDGSFVKSLSRGICSGSMFLIFLLSKLLPITSL